MKKNILVFLQENLAIILACLAIAIWVVIDIARNGGDIYQYVNQVVVLIYILSFFLLLLQILIWKQKGKLTKKKNLFFATIIIGNIALLLLQFTDTKMESVLIFFVLSAIIYLSFILAIIQLIVYSASKVKHSE